MRKMKGFTPLIRSIGRCFLVGHILLAGYILGQQGAATPTSEPALDNNTRAEIAYRAGLRLARAGKHKEAIASYLRSIELRPKDARVHISLSDAYERTGEYQNALQSCHKAIELDAKNSHGYTNCGVVYFRLDDLDRAIEHYSTALQLDGRNALIYTNRGNAFEKLEMHAQAIEDYSRAIDIEPNAVRYGLRGYSHLMAGMYQKTIADLDRAIELDPKDSDFYNNRGLAYARQGKYSLAIHDYNKSIALNPRVWQPVSNRGDAVSALGDSAAAKIDHEKAASLRSAASSQRSIPEKAAPAKSAVQAEPAGAGFDRNEVRAPSANREKPMAGPEPRPVATAAPPLPPGPSPADSAPKVEPPAQPTERSQTAPLLQEVCRGGVISDNLEGPTTWGGHRITATTAEGGVVIVFVRLVVEPGTYQWAAGGVAHRVSGGLKPGQLQPGPDGRADRCVGSCGSVWILSKDQIAQATGASTVSPQLVKMWTTNPPETLRPLLHRGTAELFAVTELTEGLRPDEPPRAVVLQNAKRIVRFELDSN